MAKYIVNPILLKMKESAKGSIYQSIVAMGFRSRQINDDIRYELRYRMQDIVPTTDEIEKANPDQLAISREFERLPKPTFIAMKEMYDEKLHFSYTLADAEKLVEEVEAARIAKEAEANASIETIAEPEPIEEVEEITTKPKAKRSTRKKDATA
ncbi:MAG: DNA-directed RNA polymerase subunit omega [Ignavibacteria bacterium]|jgi:hypothetical protein|nr:DNA-directed RNA polymerase subunit omega [Ignavibacteria bacterium]